MLKINLFIIAVIVLINVLTAKANTYSLENNGNTYTIIYNSIEGYGMVLSTVECINTLRSHYSLKKLSKKALIERTNIAIMNLRKVACIRIIE